ncbi:MAG: hypothetical protein L0Y72_06575 [Gemmataceae bacterium]|nr:hypothetical protein [Gemmataceae bacterium]
MSSHAIVETQPRSPAGRWLIRFLILVWVAVGALGVWALVHRFTTGKELANYNSYVPWGLWVAVYIFFMGLAAGTFLFSTLVYVFRVASLERSAKPALWTSIKKSCPPSARSIRIPLRRY